MKKLFVLFAALALLAGFAGVSIAGIEGSLHDFSIYDWSNQQICLPCHTPHNGVMLEEEGAPLWNHELSGATYNPYFSPTMETTVGQPTGSSKLCLSCHDGTVALDAFGGGLNSGILISAINADADLTDDLSDDHPISFVYDDTIATSDGALHLPSTEIVTIGSGDFQRTGTIADVMLQGGELQCAACHSVHNDFVVGDEYLLKIDIVGSQLCLACHNK